LRTLASDFVRAALRRQEIHQPPHRIEVRMTDEGRGFPDLTDQPDRDQGLDMMRQRRCRDLELVLQASNWHARMPCPDQRPEDLEPRPVTQRFEACRCIVDLHVRHDAPADAGCQTVILEYSKYDVSRGMILDSELTGSPLFHKSGYMETEEAVLALAALSQSTRLEAFRTLVKHEPDGLAAGDLARLLEVPPNTLSAHLSILTRARLVTSERRGRSIVYRSNLAEFRDVAVFLLRDCCGGRPEVCEPVVQTLQSCCSPKQKEPSRARSRV